MKDVCHVWTMSWIAFFYLVCMYLLLCMLSIWHLDLNSSLFFDILYTTWFIETSLTRFTVLSPHFLKCLLSCIYFSLLWVFSLYGLLFSCIVTWWCCVLVFILRLISELKLRNKENTNNLKLENSLERTKYISTKRSHKDCVQLVHFQLMNSSC